MTAETVNVPPQRAEADPSALSTTPATAASRPWRAVWLRCVLVPLTVLAPLVTLTPSADHRFNVYANGGLYGAKPWLLFRNAFSTVPIFLDLGNFRPLGRIVEWSLDVAVFALTALFGLPANIGLRLVSFASAILLTIAAVVFAAALVSRRERLFTAPPPVPVALLPFAVGAGLVAAGWTSTTVLFGALYLATSALVLAVAAWACRSRRPGALVVLAGAALAAFNELALLAVPLATATVLLRNRFVLGRSLLHRPRFLVLLWAGFLPVILPVRALIYHHCAGGGCYTGSDLALAGAPGALPARMLSWLPPLMWERASHGRPHVAAAVPVLALIMLAVLAWRACPGLRRLPTLDRGQTLGLASAALALLVLGASIAALNAGVQRFELGLGWRDSGLTTVAGSILLLVFWRRYLTVALVGLVLAGAFSAAANKDFRDRASHGPWPFLHDRIAQEVADFDATPAGDARRCALRATFVQTSARNNLGQGNQLSTEREVRRFDVSLNRATTLLAGAPFCTTAPR
ncbi:hypothetical protein GCM10010172_63980 [Paractinoplanes ferrugineus]|uniref:Uncharacterized protein n=1 Tax=Paractinoplanes ferrugineus TaxID=113564 RepID=A0A919IU70_9ACTN|nr:hypothetical protein [Actinoplanes ferrugineus]GIE09116.1 hypothetical protein Afe05nite_09560 [Actinoplanes ferrugineus]